ncbi:hypothetical protein [Nocardia asteroides]|uniref:hypothetical protein n=1 Tax=Nocardia asteroides TaxID=1824 RepID=UPI001E4CBFAB|nr:hypothetical protein [Nocardia asteroides]UGT63487.1 hypothetical protein LTT61_09320 [Nocardia asteroides]
MTRSRTEFPALGILCRAVLLACLLVLPGTLAPVRAAPLYAGYLDLPVVDADGERAGGVHPGLPSDAAVLGAALDQARAAGVPARRYTALLRQYWLVVAAGNARIDLAGWDPQRGPAVNAHTFTLVYVNYLRLASAHPEFWWAGLAGLAGGSFASGFFDMDDAGRVIDLPGLHALGSAVADLLRRTPPELVERTPEDITLLAGVGPRLTAADITWYQTRLMAMQKHIFIDLVPQHEAYLARGLAGIDELAAAGAIDGNLRAAWAAIAAGGTAGQIDALYRMTDREQNVIVPEQWDATAAARDGIGRVLTYVSTIAAKPAVPGVRAPGTFAPATVRAGDLVLRTPLPGFNWADRADRWRYITEDLVLRHIDLKRDPVLAAGVLAEPFPAKLSRGRLVARLPELLADLSGQWRIGG